MDVDFVDEFVEAVFVARAEVDEGLDGLVGVGRDVLPLVLFDYGDGVVGEAGEVGDAVVDVGGLVDSDEGLVEDGEEVAEELQCDGLFDDAEHHGLVPLPGVQLQELFHVREQLRALLHLQIDVFDSVVPRNVGIEHLSDLVWSEFRRKELGPENSDNEINVFGRGLFPDYVLDVLICVSKSLQLLT